MSSEQPKEKEKSSALEQAWERFTLLDKNAIRRQSYFKKEQIWILALGVLVTILALTQSQLLDIELIKKDLFIDKLFHLFIVLLPITTSVLIAASNRFKEGNKWILLRAGAEAIKREIYLYRVFKKVFIDKKSTELSLEERLVDKINRISEKLGKTEINLMALLPLEEKDIEKYKDRLNLLEPDDYIKNRLDDQLNFYDKKTKKLEKKLKLLHWLIYIIGGLGTFLAAMGFELWVALTSTLVATITTYLQYQQVENTLMVYNQAVINLSNIKAWWTALPDEKRKKSENIKNLVKHTETALQNELSGWVQHMEDALADLYEPED